MDVINYRIIITFTFCYSYTCLDLICKTVRTMHSLTAAPSCGVTGPESMNMAAVPRALASFTNIATVTVTQNFILVLLWRFIAHVHTNWTIWPYLAPQVVWKFFADLATVFLGSMREYPKLTRYRYQFDKIVSTFSFYIYLGNPFPSYHISQLFHYRLIDFL